VFHACSCTTYPLPGKAAANRKVQGKERFMQTIILLTISNIFMTFAWYGHLHYKDRPLWIVIAASWLIALPEYCFQVPANRIGHYQFSAAQLKIMQEVITLLVFGIFSVAYLQEKLRWNYVLGFVLILLAVIVVFGVKPADDFTGRPASGGESATENRPMKPAA
jgi:hypothetical protein